MVRMRLPQSIFQPASIRSVNFLTIVIAAALFVILPMRAGAASPQVAFTPSNLRFGDVIVGQTQTLIVTLTNSGQGTATIASAAVSNSAFSVPNLQLPLILTAGQTAEIIITFSPKGLGGTAGTITFSSNASNALVFYGWGNGVISEALTATPSIMSFGQVAMGSSSTQLLSLTNNRSWGVTIWGVMPAGNGFSISGASFPLTLGVGKSITLKVTFAPQAAGLEGGSLFIGGPSMTVPLTGTGSSAVTAPGQLTIAPAPLNFGNVAEGTTNTLPITLSAAGGSVTVSSASSSSSQFVLEGASFPLTLTGGQTLSFNVAFTPQSSGTISGSLSFASNASNSQASETLNGVGTITTYSV